MDEPVGKNDSENSQTNAPDKAPEVVLLQEKITDEDDRKDANEDQAASSNKKTPAQWMVVSKRFWNWVKKTGFHNWITLAATVAIAAATVVYTHYAGKQWEAMQRQANDYEAKESAQLVIEDFNPIAIEIPTADQNAPDLHFTGSIRIRNVGSTVARGISVQEKAITTGRTFDPFGIKTGVGDFGMLNPGTEFSGPSLMAGEKTGEIGNFDEKTERSALIPKVFDSISIVVSYKNIFGTSMTVSDCRAYLPWNPSPIVLPQNPLLLLPPITQTNPQPPSPPSSPPHRIWLYCQFSR